MLLCFKLSNPAVLTVTAHVAWKHWYELFFSLKKILPRLGTEWIFVKSHTCPIYEMSPQFLLTSPNSAFSLTPKPSDSPEHIETLSNVKVKEKVAQLYLSLFSRPKYWRGQPFPSPGDLPTQGSNPGLPHHRWILSQLSHKGSPRILECVVSA